MAKQEWAGQETQEHSGLHILCKPNSTLANTRSPLTLAQDNPFSPKRPFRGGQPRPPRDWRPISFLHLLAKKKKKKTHKQTRTLDLGWCELTRDCS